MCSNALQWVTIQSESDLPKEETTYLCKHKLGGFYEYRYEKDNRDLCAIWRLLIEAYLAPIPTLSPALTAEEVNNDLPNKNPAVNFFAKQVFNKGIISVLEEYYQLASTPPPTQPTQEVNLFAKQVTMQEIEPSILVEYRPVLRTEAIETIINILGDNNGKKAEQIANLFYTAQEVKETDAVGFAEWISINQYSWSYQMDGTPYWFKDVIGSHDRHNIKYSAAQLYQLFLKDKK